MVKRSVGADSNPEEKKEAVKLADVQVNKIADDCKIVFRFNNKRHHSIIINRDEPQDLIEKLLKLVDQLRADVYRKLL